MASGMSEPSQQSQQSHWHWQESDSFMPRIKGSTDSTTAMGRLFFPRSCWSRPSITALEENTFAEPSLPNRMARLSKTARPEMATGRVVPTKASAVMR